MSSEAIVNSNTFEHRVVRDLAWVIQSPPLISGSIESVHWWSSQDCQTEFLNCLSPLKALDKNPSPLIEHITSIKNKRLGSYFEGLVSYWLFISPNYRVLEQNIQIIHENHTYGEIDFIIENINNNKVIHLEVAVKFYLGSAPYEDSYRWFGTNTKDQLGKKFSHLVKQQTQISNKYPELLKYYFSQTIDEKQCLMKGRLFYSINNDIAPNNLPLAKDHLRGRWSYINKRDESKSLIKLDKVNWLSELNNNDINELDYESSSAIEKIDRAECFSDVIEYDNKKQEAQRVFYLPNNFVFPD